MRNLIVAGLMAGIALPFAPAAHAQDANVEAAGDLGAGEIIVTARRREENLSTVPAAITAFSPQDLLERGIKTDSDLQVATPGLSSLGLTITALPAASEQAMPLSTV